MQSVINDTNNAVIGTHEFMKLVMKIVINLNNQTKKKKKENKERKKKRLLLIFAFKVKGF